MKKLIVLLTVLGFIACGKETKGNLTITGNIDGLKEGTIFLQKVQDTTLITLDSLLVNGDAHFTFSTTIEEPEVLYLYLSKKDFNELNDRIDFFAEPGEMTINTTLRRFVNDVQITGSKNHTELIAFKEFMTKYNTKELMLLRDGMNAQKEEDTKKVAEINDKIANYSKSRMRYILNYAFTNNDKEITPYVVTTETYDANVRFLDTIYGQLTPRIMESKYGKELKELIEKRKLEEAK
ncbi:DUF4369 domain-containing protein [Kordia sp. YSTF-M3]|uniref:DUF4369 domain-containing protein n=1 Tax=Kordia aestuariivivens TaxID=2759037 RepID=A0ABR7QG91_9FLAO|nr:DUF4369 domain-containing protein [Kordia aestuariivivens]MBC8757528.1 DUF4369 domain-containing protein [Kordia aestuariivivens]